VKNITFVIPCKGRLNHIKETLPRITNLGDNDVVFVDYKCPEKSRQWVKSHYPSVKVIYVDDDDGFCLPRARNIGAAHVQTPWIFFIDADILVQVELGPWLSNKLQGKLIYRASLINGERDRETWGSFICPSSLFNAVGGYDEVFRGWGGEDEDIYRRLNKLKITTDFYPSNYVKPISHGDDERTKYQIIKDIKINHVVNELYMTAKYYFSSQLDDDSKLPLSLRNELMKSIKDKVIEWDAIGRPDSFPLVLKTANKKWLPKPYRMKIETTLNLIIENK